MHKSMYKRGKFGCLPGDIYKGFKIRMLEDKHAFKVSAWHTLTVAAIRTYRNDHYKKINRRFRKGNKIK